MVTEVDESSNVLPVVEIVVLQIPALHVTVWGNKHMQIPLQHYYCGVCTMAMEFDNECYIHTPNVRVEGKKRREKWFSKGGGE